MPPRKRGRPSKKDKNEESRTDSKKAKISDNVKADLPSAPPTQPLPPKRGTDTYIPRQSKAQAKKKVVDLIKRTLERYKTDDLDQQQLILLISNTEGDLLLAGSGVDGKNSMEDIQDTSGCNIVISNKTFGVVERHVFLNGNVKQIILGALHIAYFLSDSLETTDTETIYHLTTIISGPIVQSIGYEKTQNIFPNSDISRVFIPFSNYQSIRIQGYLPQLINSLFRLLQETVKFSSTTSSSASSSLPTISPTSLSNSSSSSSVSSSFNVKFYNDFTATRAPILGLQRGKFVRSSINQSILEKSKNLYERYINQSHINSFDFAKKEINLKDLSMEQLQEATLMAQKKTKTLEALKQQIDVPLDYVSKIIGKNGTKVNEIRAKSNSNVVIGEEVKNENYRTVTITGLPESNLTALRYITGILSL
ncbi:hypothetical protein WICMUC_001747 [Wickerhamomyces mucosus]|uniref:K Homology domain-containing protein n=1 Tax=Wickerhamomyces mucosus TaxID=1378264 RepID=A0A9P8TG85_9ASCO|nr:hypothetical protein WICMUC_001747 [Wickerhamomyces mucosus]